ELHRQIQDMNTTNEIIANYSVAFISIKDRAYANLTLQLPMQQLILGYWRLTVVVSTLKSVGQGFEPTGQTTTYHVPINISDSLSFGQQFTFIQRGYNQSVDLPIFVDETNRSHILSPTDNFTLVGSLSYETTGESFDSTYFARTSGVIEVNTSLSNLATLDWSQPSALQVHNQSGRFVWEGNFSNLAGANPKRTWGINFVVPTRGLFGNVSSSLEITFPNDLLFNDTTTPSSLQIPILTTIDEFTIRFTSALTTETLPFSNVFYLTQFVEGGFEINTTRHDVSFINATYPNNNISAQLEIPLSDLSFDVFLAERGTSNSKMKFLISQQGSGFTYSSRIDPNLPVPQDYDLRISWIDPTYVNDTVASVIAFLSTQSPVFRVSLRGSLSVQFPAETLSAPQGSNLLIRFNVSVDELGVPARGLRAFGVICGSTESCSTNNSHLPIAEKDGEFTLYYTVGTDVEMGEYQIILYTEAGLELGSIKVIITAQEIGPVFQTIVEPELTVIVGALLLAGITLTYLGIVFVKFR
ncbi:MAG TPA: hypothetical protein VJ044_00430, partial [Candidatus Hodarchaeales archaeon]|nr:hypothetical protein [Candidatus Hodarchaeales archaeon]